MRHTASAAGRNGEFLLCGMRRRAGRGSVGGGRRVCARELASRVCQPPSPLEFALDEIAQSLESRTRWIPTRRAAMPPLLPYLRDDELQRFVQRPVSRLPSFQLVDGPIQFKCRGVFQGNNVRVKSGRPPHEVFDEISNSPASLVAVRCAMAVAMLK